MTTRTRPSVASASSTGTAIEELVATRTTQTNEVGRCLALVPALAEVARATGGPLSLLEVGCSAGLNLRFDRYRLGYGDPPAVGGRPGLGAAAAGAGVRGPPGAAPGGAAGDRRSGGAGPVTDRRA